MADLQATTASGDILTNTGSAIDGVTRADLAADSAFTSVYATIAALNDLEAGSGNLPAGGATGEVLAKNSGTDYDVEWIAIPTPSGDGTIPGVTLESFAGASDDAKLGAAMTYCNAQEFPPTILMWENRDYGPFTTARTLYSGFAIDGGARFASQYRSAESTPNRVLINKTGPWLELPRATNIFDVSITNLSFYSQSSTADFMGNASGGSSQGVLWTSVIRDVGFSLFRNCFGNTSESLALTGCTFDGFWNINNARGVSIVIGGSDNNLWMDGCLVDTPTSLSSGGAVPYHVWFSHLGKTVVGPMFITAEGKPAAIKVTGSDTSGLLTLRGVRAEGRNHAAPAYGAVIRQESGQTLYDGCFVNFAMSDPGSSGRSSEEGVITVLGGVAVIQNCQYNRATGVDVALPFVYASGASTEVYIDRVFRGAGSGGPTWGANRPRYEDDGVAVFESDSTCLTV
jgi:hypothetical protein